MMDGTNPRRDDPALAPNLRRRRRSAWNPASWTSTPTGSSLAPNPGYRRPAAPGSRRFAPTEHLAPEAVAAYVDGELGMSAHMRATHHLAMCPECVAAIDAQMAARTRLRASGGLSVPADLLGQLSQIPTREIDMTGHGVNAATGTDATTDRHRAGGLRGSAARGDRRPGSRVVGPAPAPAPPAPQAMTRGRMNRWRSR